MQAIYNIIFTVFVILISPFYMMKLWKRGNWQKGFSQRFGKYDHTVKQAVTNSHAVWVHGVSVGEANISINLVNKLISLRPLLKFVVSTTTTTGMGQLRSKLPPFVSKIYYPIDRKKYVDRALSVIRPELVVLVEAEIWPNFLWRAQRRRIPVMLINARISDRSFARYKRFKFLFGPLFQQLVMVGAQNEEDKKKLIQLGCRESAVHVTGPIKFDIAQPISQSRLDVEKLLSTIGVQADKTHILLGGSTHPGEEKILGRVFLRLKKQFPNLFLIQVPRHFERSASVANEMKELGIRTCFRTELSAMRNPSEERTSDCLIVNSTGELIYFYKTATIVFIGKSLCSEGGQNPIEPASLGIPIVFGPNMQNFTEISDSLLESGGARQVEDEEDLEKTLEQLFISPAKRNAMGACALEITKERQGALGKTLDLIEQYFPELD